MQWLDQYPTASCKRFSGPYLSALVPMAERIDHIRRAIALLFASAAVGAPLLPELEIATCDPEKPADVIVMSKLAALVAVQPFEVLCTFGDPT